MTPFVQKGLMRTVKHATKSFPLGAWPSLVRRGGGFFTAKAWCEGDANYWELTFAGNQLIPMNDDDEWVYLEDVAIVDWIASKLPEFNPKEKPE